MGAEVRWLIQFLISSSIYLVFANIPHKKFEYKYSFKPPYLAQKDGSVPFWGYGGHAIASSENVRIAPSLRSQKGGIWTKSKTDFDWWEVDIIFRVTGRGRIGADGLAFWYVEEKGAHDGPVFGSSDKWNGLAVFFDSFDNDNKHNNPYIMAMVNDGTKEFDHANDGSSQMLSGCIKDFRNKPFPTRARVEYYMNTLTVLFHSGMTNSDQDYEICLRVENLVLPKRSFFGVSAATGGLADDHDILHFLTTSLYPPGTQPAAPGALGVSPEEENKITQEYEEYQKKLDHQKEEYKKEHPGANLKDQGNEFDDWFESDSQRELRQIFSGQSLISDQIKMLSSKLDEVIGRQERALGLIANIHTAGGVQPQIGIQQQPGAGQPMMVDTIRRHEVDTVIANQNNILAQTRELRNFLVEVHTRTESILQKQDRAAPGTGAAASSPETAALLREVKDSVANLRHAQQQPPQPSLLSPCPSCVTPLALFLGFFAHLILTFFYFMYRDNKGAREKKFY